MNNSLSPKSETPCKNKVLCGDFCTGKCQCLGCTEPMTYCCDCKDKKPCDLSGGEGNLLAEKISVRPSSPVQQTALQELTALIVEKVPEIMELKRGCYIQEKKTGIMRMVTWSYPLAKDGVYSGVEHIALGEDSSSPWWDRANNKELKKHFIVIGRPITLEDILIACDFDDAAIAGIASVVTIWQLGKALSQQSPELHSFLLSLLKL